MTAESATTKVHYILCSTKRNIIYFDIASIADGSKLFPFHDIDNPKDHIITWQFYVFAKLKCISLSPSCNSASMKSL